MPGKASWPEWDYGQYDLKEQAIMLKLSMNTAIEMMDDGKKPPLEEVIAAMKAAVVYIDRTTIEPKV